MYFTKTSFWTGAIERAVKTFAQTLAAALTAGVAITEIDWQGGLAIAGTATVLSLLTSLADPTRADLDPGEVPTEFELTNDGLQDEVPDDTDTEEVARGKHALEGDEDAELTE